MKKSAVWKRGSYLNSEPKDTPDKEAQKPQKGQKTEENCGQHVDVKAQIRIETLGKYRQSLVKTLYKFHFFKFPTTKRVTQKFIRCLDSGLIIKLMMD